MEESDVFVAMCVCVVLHIVGGGIVEVDVLVEVHCLV